MSENNEQLENYFRQLIKDELKAVSVELKENDAKQIVDAIIPEIDSLISKRVKQHIKELVNHINNKISEDT